MDIKKNDDIKLNIESVTSEGSAVGHYNGIAVFVRGAVPGDIIVAHIIKTSKKYAIGIIKDIITASPSRIKSDCPVSDKCGGCSFRNMTYDEELKYKRSRVVDAVERIGHIQTEITDVTAADTVYNYRNKAQYPVSICDGELFAGFYAYKTHRIISCDDCKLQSKNFKPCLDAFAKWVEHSGVTSYDENSGRGILRHIYLREACATGEIMACAVINADSLPDSDYLVEQLKAVRGVKSICVNVNKKNSNVILGEQKQFGAVIPLLTNCSAKNLLYRRIRFIKSTAPNAKNFIPRRRSTPRSTAVKRCLICTAASVQSASQWLIRQSKLSESK